MTGQTSNQDKKQGVINHVPAKANHTIFYDHPALNHTFLAPGDPAR